MFFPCGVQRSEWYEREDERYESDSISGVPELAFSVYTIYKARLPGDIRLPDTFFAVTYR